MKGYSVADYVDELNKRVTELEAQNNRLVKFKKLVSDYLALEKEIKTFDEPKPEYL